MSLFAHDVPSEETIVDKLVHPLTGFDHLAAIALVALAGTLMILAMRGRTAVDTQGGTSRIRSGALAVGAAIALAGSLVLLVAT